MNANVYVIEDYENETAFRLEQNKANQTQFQALPYLPKMLEEKRFFRIMGSCIGRFGRSRKIVRGPRGTNFPPPAPNLSLCPNDFSLQTTLRPWSFGSTYALTG